MTLSMTSSAIGERLDLVFNLVLHAVNPERSMIKGNNLPAPHVAVYDISRLWQLEDRQRA